MRRAWCRQCRPAASPWGSRRRGSRNAIVADRWSGRGGTPSPLCSRCTRSESHRRTSTKALRLSRCCPRLAAASDRPRAGEARRRWVSSPPTRRRCTWRPGGIAAADRRRNCIPRWRTRSRCTAECMRLRSWAARRGRGRSSNLRCRRGLRLRSYRQPHPRCRPLDPRCRLFRQRQQTAHRRRPRG